MFTPSLPGAAPPRAPAPPCPPRRPRDLLQVPSCSAPLVSAPDRGARATAARSRATAVVPAGSAAVESGTGEPRERLPAESRRAGPARRAPVRSPVSGQPHHRRLPRASTCTAPSSGTPRSPPRSEGRRRKHVTVRRWAERRAMPGGRGAGRTTDHRPAIRTEAHGEPGADGLMRSSCPQPWSPRSRRPAGHRLSDSTGERRRERTTALGGRAWGTTGRRKHAGSVRVPSG